MSGFSFHNYNRLAAHEESPLVNMACCPRVVSLAGSRSAFPFIYSFIIYYLIRPAGQAISLSS